MEAENGGLDRCQVRIETRQGGIDQGCIVYRHERLFIDGPSSCPAFVFSVSNKLSFRGRFCVFLLHSVNSTLLLMHSFFLAQ